MSGMSSILGGGRDQRGDRGNIKRFEVYLNYKGTEFKTVTFQNVLPTREKARDEALKFACGEMHKKERINSRILYPYFKENPDECKIKEMKEK